MIKTSGQAEVTIENRIVPIASDGYNSSQSVPERTIESALKNVDWSPKYLIGFQFAQAASVKVTRDDTGEEMTLQQETRGGKTYMFASKILTREEVTTDPAYRDFFNQVSKYNPDLFENPDTFFYAMRHGTVATARRSDLGNTAFITMQGEQLWPLMKAK